MISDWRATSENIWQITAVISAIENLTDAVLAWHKQIDLVQAIELQERVLDHVAFRHRHAFVVEMGNGIPFHTQDHRDACPVAVAPCVRWVVQEPLFLQLDQTTACK